MQWLKKFKDAGKLLSTTFKQPRGIVFGGDPCLLPLKGSWCLYHTYGPTLTRPGNSPGIYSFSLAGGALTTTDWNFHGISLRPGIAGPQIADLGGCETFSAMLVMEDLLIALYHGYGTGAKASRGNYVVIAHAHPDDPTRWQKYGHVVEQEDLMRADPRLQMISNMSEPGIIKAEISPGIEIYIGCVAVEGAHTSDTPPSPCNPLGGKKGMAWRTYIMASVNLVDWHIDGENIILPPHSYSSGSGPNSETHPCLAVHDGFVHLLTTHSGNWNDSTSTQWGRRGIRHRASPVGWPLEFAQNPEFENGLIMERNPDDVAPDGGQIGGPSLVFHGSEIAMAYHADNRWRAENGGPAVKDAIAASETQGRPHIRLARMT